MEMEKNKNKNRKHRIDKIRLYLDQIGLGEVWYKIFYSEENINVLIANIKNRCKNISQQESLLTIREMRLLAFYRTIRKDWGREEYISICTKKR